MLKGLENIGLRDDDLLGLAGFILNSNRNRYSLLDFLQVLILIKF